MCACTESWVVPNQNLSQAQTWFCYALVESGELLHPLSECLRTVTVHQTTNATYKCTTVRLASISERQKFGRGCGNGTRSLQYANLYLRKSLCNIKDSNTFFTGEGTFLIQGFNYTLTVRIVGTTPTWWIIAAAKSVVTLMWVMVIPPLSKTGPNLATEFKKAVS